jgi:hypothetical protein
MPRKNKHTSQYSFISTNRIARLRTVNILVSNEQKTFHSPQVEKLTDEAAPLMRERNGLAAERLYRQALSIEPGEPDLLNNFAGSLILQNRSNEGQAVLETIHLLFPDYLFARTGLASFAARAGDFVRAESLLEPLYERRKMHYSEFDSLCIAQIELMILQSELAIAKDWFKMWEDCNPKNPKLDFYRRLFQQDSSKSG